MNASRAVVERAVAEARQKLLAPIQPGDPGGVVLVASRGEHVASASSGVASLDTRDPISLHTSFDVGSVTKVVTGLAVAILEEEGALSPIDRLRDLLPEFPAYGDALRLEHLLHQESGLRNYFGLLYYRAGWHPRLSPSPDEVFEALCRVGSLTFEPGSKYQYCDSNYFLLARVVERVSGERFGTFARSRILDPLGMKDTYISDIVAQGREKAEGYVDYAIDLESPFKLRGIGAPRTPLQPVRLDYQHAGAEGLYASANDLALLTKHILFPSLVAPETMRNRVLHAPRVRDDGLGYGYGLNVGTYRGRRFIGHDGGIWGYSASVAVFPDDGLEIVALTNRDDLGAWDLRSAVLDSLGIGTQNADVAKPPVRRGAPPKRSWKQLVGLYLDPATPASYLEILEHDAGPAVSFSGGEAVDLDWLDEATLEGPGGRPAITISAAGRGRPTLEVREVDGITSRFEPFVEAKGRGAFLDYEGAYHCVELTTTYGVEATQTGIRLRNRDPRRPSMDLDYTPTIRDYFWSRDAYPGLVEVRFERDGGDVRSFVYRGGREDLYFVRLP
jgi:CubicO group peptidase (beta-lactamase class C family)